MLGMSEQKILWDMGGEPLILKKNHIKVIKRGSVRIYPLFELKNFMNYNEICVLANTLSINLKKKDIDCSVLEKNTYTFELNGIWNVVLSIKYTKNEKEFYAMCSIVNSEYHKKTYICPFYNIEYASINHHSINCDSSFKEFKILEDEIKSSLDVKYIDSFPNPIHLL